MKFFLIIFSTVLLGALGLIFGFMLDFVLVENQSYLIYTFCILFCALPFIFTNVRSNKTIISIFLVIVLILTSLYWKFFTVHYSLNGESTFLKTNELELKVASIYEYLPLHYVGDTYRVICRSKETESVQLNEPFIGLGWTGVPLFLKNEILATVAPKYDHVKLSEQAKTKVAFLNKKILFILNDSSLYISFDLCRNFVKWDASQIPLEALILNQAYSSCVNMMSNQSRKNIETDCLYTIFEDENRLQFYNLQSLYEGHAQFDISSKSFKNEQSLTFQSKDYGKTWNQVIVK